MKLACPKCRHTWRGVVRLGDRGHIVMKRGSCHVYVEDDIVYVMPLRLDRIREMLEAAGFHALVHSCPGCGHTEARIVRGLLTQHLPDERHEVIAYELTAEDFDVSLAQPKIREEVLHTIDMLR